MSVPPHLPRRRHPRPHSARRYPMEDRPFPPTPVTPRESRSLAGTRRARRDRTSPLERIRWRPRLALAGAGAIPILLVCTTTQVTRR